MAPAWNLKPLRVFRDAPPERWHHQMYLRILDRAGPDLTDRLVELDNSAVERTIRPIAIGWQDSHFLGQEASA